MHNQNFRQAIAEYIDKQALPREKFGHQPRLYELSRQVGRDLEYDDDVVYASAWLHDLGVFIGHRPEDLEELKRWDNTIYAMEKAPGILRHVGFPEEKIKFVVEAIRTHQPSQQPLSIEGKILRDADILEQLGAIAVLRTVCKVGRDTRFLDFTAAVKSLKQALQLLPGQIALESAREVAKPKIAALRSFLQSIEEESLSALF